MPECGLDRIKADYILTTYYIQVTKKEGNFIFQNAIFQVCFGKNVREYRKGRKEGKGRKGMCQYANVPICQLI